MLSLTAFSTALKPQFPYSLSASFPVWSGKIWTLFPPVFSFINTLLHYRQAAQYTWKCALKVTGDTTYKLNRNQTHQCLHFSCCFACSPMPNTIPGLHFKDPSVIPMEHSENFFSGRKRKAQPAPDVFLWAEPQVRSSWKVSPHSHKPSLVSQCKGTQIWHLARTTGMKGSTGHPRVKQLNDSLNGKQTEVSVVKEDLFSAI